MTDYVYVLRCVNDDMTSSHGFKWPTHGYVECPDWDPKPECGNGLHGFLWGEGDLGVAQWNNTSKWLVVKVQTHEIVMLDGNVKFPRGEVVFCGDRLAAVDTIIHYGATGALHFVHRQGGDGSSLTGGDYCNLTGGHACTLEGGNHAILTCGNDSTVTGQALCTITSGDRSILRAWYESTLIGGIHCTFHAGLDSVFVSWCMKVNRRITATVGENGIKPYTDYKIKDGKFVPT